MSDLLTRQLEILYASADRDAVFRAIRAIVHDLTGSDEIAIFERNGANYSLSASFGVDAARLSGFRAGDGPIGRLLQHGEIFVSANAAGNDLRLEACIPLKKRDKITGAILVFRVQAHEPLMPRADVEVLELFATHASTAIDRATLYERSAIVAV